MKFVRGIHNMKVHHNGCVLTIGNFDAVHRGHQAILKFLKQPSQRLGLPMIVMIFEPQPLELFLNISTNIPARLTSLRDKIKYFIEYEVDYLLCVTFHHKFASFTSQNFIVKWLVEKLGVKLLAIGDDFRFGKKRQGDFTYFSEAGEQYAFQVAHTESCCDAGNRVSSTAVRQALLSDNLTIAEKPLPIKW